MSTDRPEGEEPETAEVPQEDSSEAPEAESPEPAGDGPGEGERIAKVLARAGVASRRDCERLILEGRVTRNGAVVESPAVNVGPSDRLAVDGAPVGAAEPVRLWLYHKPAGLVTTERDEEGRPTVFDNLPEGLPRVMSVGRLDLTSEGLLLLTNDGEVKRRLELPSTGWLRRYRVRVSGALSEGSLDELRRGITVDGFDFEPMEVEFDRQQGANAWLTVGLREGKNREIRRVMEHLGVQVSRLLRLSYGPFQLGNLAPGEVEEVKPRVVRDQLGLGVAPKRVRPTAAALPEPAQPARPEREALATNLPDGAVRRSVKPRAAPARRVRAEPSAKPSPRPAAPKTTPLGERAQRTFLRKDGPRPVTEATEAESRAAARAAREAAAEGPHRRTGPASGPRADRPREDRTQRGERPAGGAPRSAGFRSHARRGPEGGEERPRSEGYRSHRDGAPGPRPGGFKGGARPPREGGDDRPRAGGPRGPRREEGGPRPYTPRGEGDRPARSGAKPEAGARPARPARFAGPGRGERSDGDRPARFERDGAPRGSTSRGPRPDGYSGPRGPRAGPRSGGAGSSGGEGARGPRPQRAGGAREERPRSGPPRAGGKPAPHAGARPGASDRPARSGAKGPPRQGDRPAGDRGGDRGGDRPAGGPRRGPPRGGPGGPGGSSGGPRGAPRGRKPRKE